MSNSRFVSLMILAALLQAPAMFAQFDSGAVLGTVQDASSAVVTGAKVTLENTSTGVTATATTNVSGNYEFPNVSRGTYRVRAEAAGFKAAVAEEFTVTVGARQRVDLKLQVGETTQTIEISGAAAVLETESSDRGQVINNATDREPAVERKVIRRSGAAGAGRTQELPGHGPEQQQLPRVVIQRQRAAQRVQQFSGGRRGQQRLQHQQPGLLEPGDPTEPGRRRRVQGADEQLQRRVRARGRSDRQCRHEERHQPVSRRSVGLPAQHQPERGGLLQAGAGQAGLPAEPVRRSAGRTHHPQQDVLLRRLRRHAPRHQVALLPDDSHARSAQRHLRPAHQESVHGRDLLQRSGSEIADHALRAEGVQPTGGADDAGDREQLSGAAPRPDGGQQGRPPRRSLLQHQADRVFPLQPARVFADRHTRAAPAHRGGFEQREREYREQAVGGRRHLYPEPDLCAGVPAGRHAVDRGQVAGADRAAEPAGRVRHPRSAHRSGAHRRSQHAEYLGLHRDGTPQQHAAVPEPERVQPESQLLQDVRAAHFEVRLRDADDPHGSARLQPAIRPGYLQRPVQRSHGRRREQHLQRGRFPVRRAQRLLAHQLVRRAIPAAHEFHVRTGRLQSVDPAHAEPGRSLRVRHAAVGRRAAPLQLQYRHAENDRRIVGRHLQPLAGASGPQQLGAARRPRVLGDAQDRDPHRLRHQLHPLQPGRRREFAGLQSALGDQHRDQQSHSVGSAYLRARCGVHGVLPSDGARLPGEHARPEADQPGEHVAALHARPTLAPGMCRAGTSPFSSNSPRTWWWTWHTWATAA